MANVIFKKGLLANLPSTITAGTFYVTTDERAIYLDVDDTSRIRLGDFQEFATLAELQANPNPSTTALYFVTELNCLVKYNGTAYVQINRDTGMTSVEVVGDGNAVTVAAYDAEGRKLTLTKGATFATKAELDALNARVGEIPEGYTEETVVAYINKKAEETLNAASGGSSESAASVLAALNTYKAENDPKVQANADAIDAIESDYLKNADKTELQGNIDGVAERMTTAEGEIDALQEASAKHALDTDLTAEADRAKAAEEANANAAAAALAEAQAKVDSVTAGDASVTVGGTSTAPTVAAKLSQDADNALELAEDGLKVVIPAAAEYSIVKAENSGDYAAVYNLTKGGEIVGASINIPKDMVVESGSVVENPDGQTEGTYIKLVLQNVAEPLYINVGSLIEYVTSGSSVGDMVVIAVSDDHKVTATITDGSITLAKLHTDIQTAIGKAHSHENADVLAGINADKVAAWDAAEQNAKDHANDLNTAMDTRMQAVEDKAHEHTNKDELDKIADGDVAKWNAAQANAEKTASDALAAAKTELEGKITAEAERAAAAEKANADAIDAIEDDYLKVADKTELYDAISAEKTRAEAAEAQALTDAKAYTNAALTWGSF